MSGPNFFRDPLPYNRVKIGGQLIKAILVEIDGTKIEYEWSEQKPTGSSGATWVFKGGKPAGPHELTFEAVDADGFDDLGDLFERFAPKPDLGSGAANASSTANAYTIGQTKDASSAPAGGGTSAPVTVPDKTTAKDAAKDAKGSNPGPRPPTLSIENAFLAYVGTVAVSLKSWDGPNPTATNSVRVKIDLIPQKPPVPAGTGVAPPKTGDTFTIGATKDQPEGSGSKAFDKGAAEAGAAT